MKRITQFTLLVILASMIFFYRIADDKKNVVINLTLEESNYLSEAHFEQLVLYATSPDGRSSIVEGTSGSKHKKTWFLDNDKFSISEFELRDRVQTAAPFKREILHADFKSLKSKNQPINLTVGGDTISVTFSFEGHQLSNNDRSNKSLYQAELLQMNSSGKNSLLQRSPVLPGCKSQFVLIFPGEYIINLMDPNGDIKYTGTVIIVNHSEVIQTVVANLEKMNPRTNQ